MTPIYHDNVSQFQHIAPDRSQTRLKNTKVDQHSHRKKKRATDARAKHAQVAAPDFWTQQDEKGQLELPKMSPEGGTKLPQSQSKSHTRKVWFRTPLTRFWRFFTFVVASKFSKNLSYFTLETALFLTLSVVSFFDWFWGSRVPHFGASVSSTN